MNQRFHFIGIGGAGMAPLAYLMVAKGYEVSGSDVKDSPVVQKLRDQGVKIFLGHEAKNVQGADFVVYSSAIAQENPEIITAKDKHISILKRAQLLARLMNAQIGVAVAGAHGKTTTTSMISNLLIQAKLKPTTAIGGIVGYNAALGDGRYFVAETDESDGSFLFFRPQYAVVTNIDFEHVDYYETWENILSAYNRFMHQVLDSGGLVVCGDDSNLRKLIHNLKKPILTYGFGQDNDFYCDNVSMSEFNSQFDCYFQGKKIGRFELAVPGKHNILNAMACIGIGHFLKIDIKPIQQSLKEYRSVQRRFQLKGEVEGVMVVDDYGHHPTEIKATLEAARLFNRKRLITVFQPHRYSRTKFLMDEFVQCLAATDYLILTDIYAASEQAVEGVSAQILWEKLKGAHPGEVVYLKKNEIVEHLLNLVQPGDFVLTLGAGDVTHLSDELVTQLQAKKSLK